MRAVYRDMLTLFDRLEEVEGRRATAEELELVHDPAYLERLRGWVARAADEGRPVEVAGGAIVSGATWDAATAAVGSALTAVDRVLDGAASAAFVAARPPGAAAGADHPGGFGFLNTVAIAARYALEMRGVERVLVVEWRGSGRSALPELLAGSPRVTLASLAPVGEPEPDPEPEAPGASAIAATLPDGATGADLGAALTDLLARVERLDAPPDLVLLANGLDIVAGDPLGRLSVTPRELFDLTGILLDWARRHAGGRLVGVLEGGYGGAEVGAAVVQHLRALAELPPAD